MSSSGAENIVLYDWLSFPPKDHTSEELDESRMLCFRRRAVRPGRRPPGGWLPQAPVGPRNRRRVLLSFFSIPGAYGREGTATALPASAAAAAELAKIFIDFFNIIWTFIANADTLKIIINANNRSVTAWSDKRSCGGSPR